MKLLAKKLDEMETRVPINGLKQIFRYTKFEIEYNDQVDIILVGNQNIIKMDLLDSDDALYEIELDSEYAALLLNSREKI